MRTSFRFSGTGGQGLITAGIILAEAALLDDKLAVQSQSYGPEARGGSSKAEAIISDEAIYFSRVIDPDFPQKTTYSPFSTDRFTSTREYLPSAAG